MSIKVMTRVWEESEQSGGALLILLALADFSNDNGESWPAMTTIARKARMSKRNAQLTIAKLVEAGELSIERNTGKRGTNTYKILSGGGEKSSRGEAHFMGGMKPTSSEPSVEPIYTNVSDVGRTVKSGVPPVGRPTEAEPPVAQPLPELFPEINVDELIPPEDHTPSIETLAESVPRTYQDWSTRVSGSKNKNGELMSMYETLYPQRSPPPYSFLGKVAKQIGPGALCKWFWDCASRGLLDEPLAYILKANGNIKARANGQEPGRPVQVIDTTHLRENAVE